MDREREGALTDIFCERTALVEHVTDALSLCLLALWSFAIVVGASSLLLVIKQNKHSLTACVSFVLYLDDCVCVNFFRESHVPMTGLDD